MMAAASLLQAWSKAHIHLFEKNSRLWAKVIISWWGRCNVTTGTFKRKELLQHYTRGAEFLDHAFRQFGPKKVRKRFEDQGVPLKQEEDGRIFPVSNDGKDIVWVFETLFETAPNVTIHFKESVDSIQSHWPNNFTLTSAHSTYQCTHVVVATWWEAYAHTGSTWDWYSFARSIWHTITPLWPSLNSFMCTQKWIHECSWISFQNAALHCGEKNITVPWSWPVLLTHFWLTWPHVFVLASHTAFEPITNEQPLDIFLIPDKSKTPYEREQFFLDHSLKSPKKTLTNILSTALPKRFTENFLGEYGFQNNVTMSMITKVQRKHLCKLLGQWIQLTLIKRRPWDEFVTAWWVQTSEVNPKTMESLLVPWVYFVWEVLNIDWVTGWYNLQGSWATWKMAGESIE